MNHFIKTGAKIKSLEIKLQKLIERVTDPSNKIEYEALKKFAEFQFLVIGDEKKSKEIYEK